MSKDKSKKKIVNQKIKQRSKKTKLKVYIKSVYLQIIYQKPNIRQLIKSQILQFSGQQI